MLQFVDSNGCYIIPYRCALSRNVQQFVQNEVVNEPGAILLCLQNGTCIGYTHNPTTRTHPQWRSKSDGELLLAQSPEQSCKLVMNIVLLER